MRRGFSSLDVLLSVFIVALVAYVASSSLLSLRPKYVLQKSLWEIHTCLHAARYQAIIKGEKVRVRFFPSGYSIDTYDDVRKTWMAEKKHSLEGVNFEANNSPCFHPNGAVSNLASIYVWNSWGRYKISVAITGRVKIKREK
ncbi:MAG: Tfp pilus assembly protein FimT/FimU [Candidatus Aminicenantales bacterium]